MPWPVMRFDFMSSPAVTALGWALLHFVWQGALAALTLWAALKSGHAGTPRARHGMS